MAQQGGLLPEQSQLGYENTLMYGHYTKSLGDYAKEEAKRIKKVQRNRQKQIMRLQNQQNQKVKKTNKIVSAAGWLWQGTRAKLGEDWIFLALLGIIMAFVSYFLDYGVRVCHYARIYLYSDVTSNPGLQYLLWIVLPVLLILFSAAFVHLVAPQAIGSGVPEVKTILRGVALEECLTIRTLIAKVIGLIATLGSGIPLGKEAPFVHIASIIANQLSKLMSKVQQGIYETQSRKTDMLAAACAVGLASCFAAPVGGLLYSIEVTSVYFAVRNYSRGFFAAVCCVIVFRLFAVWIEHEETLTALYPTTFAEHIPFDLQELAIFAAMGVVCGLGGAAYVWLHRQYVFLMRRSPAVSKFLQENRFLYPFIVAITFSSVSFPLGLGKYMASELDTHHQIVDLFTNFTWTSDNISAEEAEVIHHWTTPETGVFVSLAGFTAFTFVFSIIGATVAIPSGNFIPVFKLGAGLGRILGELMHLWFPLGMGYAGLTVPIIPGGYATAGAAAFTGAVTHSISVAVIVVEMTGQLTHVMPIIISVLISNAIAALLQPSLYESMILIKKLPYLPVLLPYTSGLYSVYVEAFMVRDVKFIWQNMSYQSLVNTLKENKELRGFPLVDNPDSMILLGSIQRFELIRLIERQIGRERRQQVAAKWHRNSQRTEREELERKLWEKLQRKFQPASRFEVIPAEIHVNPAYHSSDDVASPSGKLPAISNLPLRDPASLADRPMKSILKQSLGTLRRSSSLMATGSTFPPVSGSDSRIRLVLDSLFRRTAPSGGHYDPELGQLIDELAASPRAATKKVRLPSERVIDMTAEEQHRWEKEQMKQIVKFHNCPVDPAPFQLVEKTSLMKCHTLFSLVGVNHAYVTTIGRLIGVVGLKELRKAIEDSNAGNLPLPPERSPSLSQSPPHDDWRQDDRAQDDRAQDDRAQDDQAEDDDMLTGEPRELRKAGSNSSLNSMPRSNSSSDVEREELAKHKPRKRLP